MKGCKKKELGARNKVVCFLEDGVFFFLFLWAVFLLCVFGWGGCIRKYGQSELPGKNMVEESRLTEGLDGEATVTLCRVV